MPFISYRFVFQSHRCWPTSLPTQLERLASDADVQISSSQLMCDCLVLHLSLFITGHHFYRFHFFFFSVCRSIELKFKWHQARSCYLLNTMSFFFGWGTTIGDSGHHARTSIERHHSIILGVCQYGRSSCGQTTDAVRCVSAPRWSLQLVRLFIFLLLLSGRRVEPVTNPDY